MPAYIIADIDVTDDPGYEAYRKAVQALIAKHGGRYLARGGATEVLEGTWRPRRAVIVEFPSMAALKAFWDDPEYQPLRKIRNKTADSRIVAVEGLSG